MIVALFDGCEVLDFTGPLQAFHEANGHGATYDVVLCAGKERVTTAQRAIIAGLKPLPTCHRRDLVLLPGYLVGMTQVPGSLIRWLRSAHAQGARIASVCTGAFALGEAGLLEGVRCTTHWRRVAELRRRFPRALVASDCLYVSDGQILTSAGITAGIDLALHLIESDFGPRVATRVAREMVVYLRRTGQESQQSVFTDFRNHLRAGIHEVQDYLSAQPERKTTLPQLAAVAGMSPRNLTRGFRQATGISVNDFRTQARLELARNLLTETALPLEDIATRCGFADARQLRRLWHSRFGETPSASRQRAANEH